MKVKKLSLEIDESKLEKGILGDISKEISERENFIFGNKKYKEHRYTDYLPNENGGIDPRYSEYYKEYREYHEKAYADERYRYIETRRR
jgi:hypothetical protein